MHAQVSMLQPMALDVQVSEPWSTRDGTVHGPDINVRPFGTQPESTVYLSLSIAEARELAATLTQRCDEAEALFGTGG